MMAMHPNNPDTILAATSGGIFKTTDGGNSWTRTSSNTDHYKDLRLKPGDPNIAYTTEGGNFYRSANNCDSWSFVSNGLSNNTRMVIGVTPADPSVVYCVLTSGTFVGLFKSTDSGLSFTNMSGNNPTNIMGYTDGDNLSQAWYDLCVAVSPTNADQVYIGSINIHRTNNSGSSFTKLTNWHNLTPLEPVHADQHIMEFSPVNGALYVGNDGGVYKTTSSGSDWTDISNGLGIAQAYRLGQSATEQQKVINGYQDNGVGLYDNGSFTTVTGGDGMESVIDYSNSNYIYSTYATTIMRSSNGGNSFFDIAGQGINGITESGAWVLPYILHETDPNTLFAGYRNIWRTNNVRSGNPNFSKISNSLGGTNNVDMRAIEQSPADVSVLYASRYDLSLIHI